jgi:predicted dienelactone hydrolase
MIALLDFMLNDWRDKASVDRNKIGLFGFSFGGYTGLALAGAKPDFDRVASMCSGNTGICGQLRSGERPDPRSDPRIRAAVIVDPPSTAFTQDNLAAIKIPLQYWRSEHGGGGVDSAGTARLAKSLPGHAAVHTVPAGHYAFLPPCTARFAESLPRLCADPPGFDRVTFHREFDASVVSFFRKHLVSEDRPR